MLGMEDTYGLPIPTPVPHGHLLVPSTIFLHIRWVCLRGKYGRISCIIAELSEQWLRRNKVLENLLASLQLFISKNFQHGSAQDVVYSSPIFNSLIVMPMSITYNVLTTTQAKCHYRMSIVPQATKSAQRWFGTTRKRFILLDGLCRFFISHVCTTYHKCYVFCKSNTQHIIHGVRRLCGAFHGWCG